LISENAVRTLFEQIKKYSDAVDSEENRSREICFRVVKKIWSLAEKVEDIPTGRFDAVLVKRGSTTVADVSDTVKVHGMSSSYIVYSLIKHGQEIAEYFVDEDSRKKFLEIVNFLKKYSGKSVYSVNFEPRKIIFYDGKFLREATVYKVVLNVDLYWGPQYFLDIVGDCPVKPSMLLTKVHLIHLHDMISQVYRMAVEDVLKIEEAVDSFLANLDSSDTV